MASEGLVVSGLVMGALLAVVVIAFRAAGNWQRHTVDRDGAARTRSGADVPAARQRANGSTGSGPPPTGGSVGAWTAGFLVVALAVAAAAIAYVGGLGGGPGTRFAAGVVLGLSGVVALVGYLFVGVYRSAKGWGLGSAQAAAVGVWVLGVLFLGAVVVNLVSLG